MTLELVPWRGAQVPLLAADITRASIQEYLGWMADSQRYMGPPMPNTTYGARPAEPVSNSFEGFVQGLLYADGPVASAEQFRLRVFGQAPMLYQEMTDGRAGDLFDDPRLDRLRAPWAGATLSDLMKRALIYGDFAGNAFVLDLEDELVLVRPDWVEIVLAKRMYRGGQVGWRQVGIMYYEGGLRVGDGVAFLPGEYAHFVPGLPDPLANYRGMSWLTPLVREVMSDKAASDHKLAFFENAASPNLAVSMPKEITPTQFREFVEKMDDQHRGAFNAYKCLHPDTDVSMWDGSLRRAADVLAGDQVVAWAEGNAALGVVSVVEEQPASPIVTVTTQRGRVIKTNDRHPFLLKDGSWIAAIDLNRGDLLVTGLGFATDDVQDSITPYEAWVLGALVGDGSTVSSTPVVSAWDEGIRTRLQIGHQLNWTGKGHDYRVLGVRASAVSAGIMGKRSWEKRIPAQVMAGSAKVKAAFISGLIDTDGHVSDPAIRRSAEVGITSTCRELLRDAQHLLASLGVNSSVSLSMPSSAARPGRDAWRLIALGNDQARRLVAVLDLACSAKAARLATYAQTPSREDRSRFDRVVSVEVGAPEVTIGIEVAGHHTHVTGGVVTHNTLYTAGGADVTVIGANMQQMDFSAVQGKGETRIANAAGVPPVLLSFSEGMQGSSLNAGNYTAAKRNFVDTTGRDLWQNWCGSIQQMDTFQPPRKASRLWYDGRDIPFLHEDQKDAAEIQQTRAATINSYVTNGWTPESAVTAVAQDDVTLLEHTGAFSVQLQPPGTTPEGVSPDGAPADATVPDPAGEDYAAALDEFRSDLAGTLDEIVRKFDPDQPRDPHSGEWLITGGALKDALKLAGKIKLDDGETFVGSDKIQSDYATVRVAVTERGGHKSIRLGLGDSAFGGREDQAGPWRGRDTVTEENARRAPLAAERNALERPALLEDFTPAELARYDELENMDLEEIYPSGHTARLDEAAAGRLRAGLSEDLAKALRDKAADDARWEEIKRLDELDKKMSNDADLHARRDPLVQKYKASQAGGPPISPEDEAELDRLTDLWLGPSNQVAALKREEPDYPVYGGSVPGEWADVEYQIYFEEDRVHSTLGAVPHGAGLTLDDLIGTETAASLDPAEVEKLIALLGKVGTSPAARSVLLTAFDMIARGWSPAQEAQHPRGSDGKFRKLTARVAAALHDFLRGDGPDDPLDGFNREQLRKAAVALDLKPRRGASSDELKLSLLAHARQSFREVDAADKAAPKLQAKFTLKGGKAPSPELVHEVETENKIRAAYRDAYRQQWGSEPHHYVGLAAIRDDLGESMSRKEIDEALTRMAVEAGGRRDNSVQIVPVENGRALSQADRDSALRMGGEDLHAIRIPDPSPRPMPGSLRDKDVAVYHEPDGKVSLYEESDAGARGRRVVTVDDVAGLESWARHNGETELADWAKGEGGKPEVAPAKAVKKAAPKAVPPTSGDRAAKVKSAKTRTEAAEALAGMKNAELAEFADENGVPLSRRTKQAMVDDIVDVMIGGRLATEAFHGLGDGKKAAPSADLTGESSAPTFTPSLSGVEDLARAVDSGTASSVPLSGGVSGSSLVTMNDGTKLVLKTVRVDEEQAAASIARALGIGPGVYRDAPDRIWIEHLDAPSAAELRKAAKAVDQAALDAFESRVERIVQSDDGQLIGLLDHLTRNADRNFDNWLVGAGDVPIPIDHGMTYSRGRLPADLRVTGPAPTLFGRFSGDFVSEDGTQWVANRLTTADIAEIRSRLKALDADFALIGRPDWLDYSLKVLDSIEPHAKGSRNLVARAGSGRRRRTPAAKRPPADVVADMRAATSREEAATHLEGKTIRELKDIADAGDIAYGSKDSRDKLKSTIVQWTAGRRLDSDAISAPPPSRVAVRPKADAAPAATRTPASPVVIRDLLAADDATIQASLRDVYEGKFGPYTTKVRVHVTRAGTRVDRRGREHPVDPSIGVEGDIYDSSGNKIGDFGRKLSATTMHYADGTVRREIWAEHQIVQLNDKANQGKGFGGEFNRRAIEWYRASGVHGISQSDHNGYVWASQGFNFTGGIVPDYQTEGLRRLVGDLRSGANKTTWDGEAIPKSLREAPDLEAQTAEAEALLARLESSKPGEPNYPTAYEISQLGRNGRRGKTAVWLGRFLGVSADELILNPDEGEVLGQ